MYDRPILQTALQQGAKSDDRSDDRKNERHRYTQKLHRLEFHTAKVAVQPPLYAQPEEKEGRQDEYDTEIVQCSDTVQSFRPTRETQGVYYSAPNRNRNEDRQVEAITLIDEDAECLEGELHTWMARQRSMEKKPHERIGH
eukprot:CAMPEP_0172820436 /NCGR_PEP_ID=MMETSP1075-20121228/15268_1 /TAXON_ID=2916 /ORGANISM="Ceratium fusus, Strain PA161109" /LENGTH=140 /DNA_ID=CAMNT_0013661113 /DNA_START=330 /DNA_END=749 /DNA_ORIENTATION=+